MDCPICHHTNHVEIDTHADGYAANIQECGDCGSVWTFKDKRIDMIHSAASPTGSKIKATECPICHSADHIEIDIHADGFAHNLEECGTCGALWSLDDGKPKLVHGATWATATR